MGGATSFQPIEGLTNLVLLISRSRFQYHSGTAGVDNHRDSIPLSQLVCEESERVLEQGQLVGRLHRTGDVDQEHQIGGGALRSRDVEALDAHSKQPGVGVPRGGSQFRGHAERHLAVGRRRVAVVEIVDHFLDAHCVLGRELAGVEEPPHIGIRARVDVNGEG